MEEEINKRDISRHSASHILAAAVLEMFPEAKFATSLITKDGFCYDFDLPRTLIPEDLEILEKIMKKIIQSNVPFERAEISPKEALKKFKKLSQDYKVELIKDILSENPKTKRLTVYRTGKFVDLCTGPHLDSSGELNPEGIKLIKVSGAYWKGNEKNRMLQRIVGVAFDKKSELNKYLCLLDQAKKRDHRKLGKDLDLFVFSDIVGPGLPLFTPKGTLIIEELKKHVENICQKKGFEKVITPHLAKIDLYRISGHDKKFADELFHVTSIHKQNYVMKPVQCPHQVQIFSSKLRSYKDLPIRYMESEKQYRAEKPGEIGGLTRVIAITVEDGHSFCRVDQVKEEIKMMVTIIKDFYKAFGLWGNHWVSLSLRDYKHPEKYIGEAKDWDTCEKTLQEISDEMSLNAVRREGEAALYGPKLDFMFQDAFGREIQIPTVQLDFATPKRFNATYINEKGAKEHPVMVHRAILGSYERFLALIIEHFAGAFPLWIAPIQVVVIPVSDKHAKYSENIVNKLSENDIRTRLDDSNETLSRRIRDAELQKIPFLLIIGDLEVKAKKISVRSRDKGDLGKTSLNAFIKKTLKAIKDKIC